MQIFVTSADLSLRLDESVNMGVMVQDRRPFCAAASTSGHQTHDPLPLLLSSRYLIAGYRNLA